MEEKPLQHLLLRLLESNEEERKVGGGGEEAGERLKTEKMQEKHRKTNSARHDELWPARKTCLIGGGGSVGGELLSGRGGREEG